jgi:hypothetical protein
MPEISQRQRKRFETQVREILKDERATEATARWDGTILWDLNGKPHLPGFKKEKLQGECAAFYDSLLSNLAKGTI